MRRTPKIVVSSLALATAFGGLVLGASPALAAAQTRYVATTGNDVENECLAQATPCKTIQHAVDRAAAGDTVSVAAGTYAQSTDVPKALTIHGVGAATIVTGATNNPTFFINGSTVGSAVVLTQLSISHNSAAPGVVVLGTALTATDVTVSDNLTAGILSLGSPLTVTDSTISDNTVSDSQSGIPFADGAGIAAIAGATTVERTTLSDNEGSGIASLDFSLLSAADIQARAAAIPSAVLDLRTSTVSGNQNGGVLSAMATSSIAQSTLTNNVGAGVVLFGGTGSVVASTITASQPFDIAGTDTSEQGGIVSLSLQALIGNSSSRIAPSAKARKAFSAEVKHLVAGHEAQLRQALRTPKVATVIPTGTAVITVAGTINAKNAPLGDCFGPVVDDGYNLSGDAKNSCKFSAAKHDLVKTDPKLSALGDHGGPTLTQVPLKGSPAIDAVPAAAGGCTTAADDQRGVARPQPTGGKCDIGAVELAAKPGVIHPASLPHGTVGKAYTVTVTATGGQYPTYVWSLAPGTTPPPGLTFSAAGVLSGTPTKAGTYKVTVSVNDPTVKTYTLVIDAPVAPAGHSDSPIAQTGPHTASMTTIGAGAIVLGFLVLMAAGFIGRRPGQHRV